MGAVRPLWRRTAADYWGYVRAIAILLRNCLMSLFHIGSLWVGSLRISTLALSHYRTTNWKAHNTALKKRGPLLIWQDKEIA